MELFSGLSFGCGIFALAAVLPGSLELALVTLGAIRKPRRFNPGGYRLRLAVVIPAHNEEKLVGACIASVAASAKQNGYCQIVVVADNCSDETATVAAGAGARVIVRHDEALRGKGYALQLAFRQLLTEQFDALMVVDADSLVSKNTIDEVKRALAAGSQAVQCRYRISDRSDSLRGRLMDLAFLAFNVMRPRGRSAWGLSAGILGNGFALHTDTLRKVPWDAASIVEDLEYHLRLISAGRRVEFINDATVFGETPSGQDAAKVQRSRWEGGRLRMAREWAPGLALDVCRGKVRMLEPLLDLLLLPLAYHVLLLGIAFIALPDPFRLYALAGLVLVAMHVIGASLLGGHFVKSAGAILAAPFYVLWKMTTIGSVLVASRRNAGWVRTERD